MTGVRRRGKTQGPRHCRVTGVPAVYKRDRAVGSGRQLTLFDLPANNGLKNGGAFRDPAFNENKSLPVHRWVPWIAGFSASFVDSVCSDYLRSTNKIKKSLVLDPFAGVGTTLLQAVLRGHDAVGFEINPYAALTASTKLQALTISLKDIDAAIDSMRRAAKNWRAGSAPGDVAPPPLHTRIPFFSPRVECQVLHAIGFIAAIKERDVANLFRTAFGSVMVSVSNYTYEPSLGSRPGAGKPLVEDADVGSVLLNKLHQMRADVAWLQEETKSSTRIGSGKVINGNFFASNEQLETGSVDLMITSPPYMNNYHYLRNTRPQLYWLSFISSPEDQRTLETENFGKYWQTVRDAEDLLLTFEHRALEDTLKQLRETRRDARAYGGPGWANYVTAYFNDCHRFMAILRRVLSRNGAGVVVIGNSIIQGMEIRVDEILGDIAVQQGLRLEGIPRVRDKRVGASITQSSVRRGVKNGATLYESAVVVRKA